MIQLTEKDRADLSELGAKLAEIYAGLEGLAVPDALRKNIGVASCRVAALSNSEEIYGALATVEDGYTPTPEEIECLRTGLYYADLLKLNEDRIRAALAAGAERRVAGRG